MLERAAALRLRLHRWVAWARRHPRLTLTMLLALALLGLGWRLTRPGARFGPQDVTWIRVQANKDLYVGLDPDYPPFTEWTPDQIDGIEADIAREIGNRLGVKTQILIMGTDSLYDSLYTGYVDLIISGLHVDPTLKEWVHYTPPYYDAGQILVSRADSPVANMRALDGKTVAVEIASQGDLAALRWQRRLHALDVERYMLPNDAMSAVQTGSADAALVDTVSAHLYLDQHDDLVMAAQTTVPDDYVIALRKANFRLIAAVERALHDMIADGTLDAIINRWL
jgi:ABC-type amino acid transport substrate-binding protein